MLCDEGGGGDDDGDRDVEPEECEVDTNELDRELVLLLSLRSWLGTLGFELVSGAVSVPRTGGVDFGTPGLPIVNQGWE